MAQAKKCPECGRVADLESRVCASCGHTFRTSFDAGRPPSPVDPRSQAQPLNPSAPPPPEPTQMVSVGGSSLPRAPRVSARLISRILFFLIALIVVWVIVYRFAPDVSR